MRLIFAATVSAVLLLSPQAQAQAPPTVFGASALQGYASLAVSNSSSRVQLPFSVTTPAGQALTICNSGSSDGYFALGGSTISATTSPTGTGAAIVRAGKCIALWTGTNGYLAGITGGSDTTTFDIYQGNGPFSSLGNGGGGRAAAGANPTASVGLSAVNGSAATFMRSDAAPALNQSISPTWTGLHTFGTTLGTSQSALAVTSVPFSGGTGTTTLPATFLSATGASAISTWSTSGTMFGILAPNSFAGSIIDARMGGSSGFFTVGGTFSISASGNLVISGNLQGGSAGQIALGSRGILSSTGAGVWQLGAANAASPIAQTLQAQGSRVGTDTNISGANVTITSGMGTGNSTVSTLTLSSPVAVGSGSGAQTQTSGLIITGGTAATRGYTVSTLPSTGVLTGSRAHVTDAVACTFLASLTGGSSIVCPVFYNGTAWVAG